MTVYDGNGYPHPDVGVGADFWGRRTNQDPGCSCPAVRYNPRFPKPTNPECQLHGEQEDAA